MPIEMTPETERLIRAEIRDGHFQSVDEIIQAGVGAWREKHTPPAGEARPDAAEPFWKAFTERLRAVPPEVFDSLPADGASEHDHYLYGSPERFVSVLSADTFYWIALTNTKDAAHRRVLEFTAKLAPRSVITTDHGRISFQF